MKKRHWLAGKLSAFVQEYRPSRQPHRSVWVLCAAHVASLVSFAIETYRSRSTRKYLSILRNAKNAMLGSKALFLGNGPSVGKLSIPHLLESQASGMDVWVVNFFPLSLLAESITPSHLVLSDPLTRISAKDDQRTVRLWHWVERNPSVTLVLPHTWAADLAKSSLQNSVLFFEETSLLGFRRGINPTRPRGFLPLTSYKGLACATWLGYDQILILGIDNSMFKHLSVDGMNRIYEGENHFFSYGGGADLTASYPGGVSDYFYELSLAFKDLSLFPKSQVFNLDESSLVDCFTKIESHPLIKSG